MRRLRDDAGLSSHEAARQIGLSQSKLIRLERAINAWKTADLNAALDLYGPPIEVRAALLDLASGARRRGWWTSYGDILVDDYVGLEAEASEIYGWETSLIPGLLQTDEYARALINQVAECEGDEDPQIDRRVAARMARKELLGRDARVSYVLSAAALEQVVGGGDVMRRQMAALWEVAQRPNVEVRVLPKDSGQYCGLDGPFTLLGFEDEEDPDVGYVEGQQGGSYLEDARQTARLRLRWARLAESALSPEDSSAVIVELTK